MEFFLNDSVVVDAYVFETDDVTPVAASAVVWQVLNPKDEHVVVSALPSAPYTGQTVMVNQLVHNETFPSTTETTVGPTTFPSGQTFVQWEGMVWNGALWLSLGVATSTITGSPANHAKLTIPPAVLASIGTYRVVATFTLTGSVKRSVVRTVEMVDPLSPAMFTADMNGTINLAWKYLEDCFDSELGGPHLRDRSLSNFDKSRLNQIANTALFEINNQQPVQSYTDTTFPFAQAQPLLAKGILLEAIRHLMRSYVEQPAVTSGGSMTFFERRDYLDRWKIIYDMEFERYKEWMAMFKRQQYNFGSGALLIDVKTRGQYMPGMRTRYPRGPIWGF